MQSNLSAGGRIICEKLKRHLFPEELTYKSLLAMAKNVVLPCTICIQRKSATFVEAAVKMMHKFQKSPTKFWRQQGYRTNLKGIGLLVMNLITADYQKDSKIEVSFSGN